MITRTLGKIVRGTATPFQLFTACALAAMLGFMPGWSQAPGLVVVLLLLLVILNANEQSIGRTTGAFARMLSKVRMSKLYLSARDKVAKLERLLSSIPVIGEAPAIKGAFMGFGHHHIGLTGGPKTGRLLAQMISGRSPNIDVSVYAPSRYAA